MTILLAAALALSPALAVDDEDAAARALLDEVVAAHAALERGVYTLTTEIEAEVAAGKVSQDHPTATIAFARQDDGSERILARSTRDGGEVVVRTLPDGGVEAWFVDEGRLVTAGPDDASMMVMQYDLPMSVDAHRLTITTDTVRALGLERVTRDGAARRAITLFDDGGEIPTTRGTLFVDVERPLVQAFEATMTMPDGGTMSITMDFDWIALGDDVGDEAFTFDPPDDVEREAFTFDIGDFLANSGVELPGADGTDGPNVGERLPDFTLRTSDGEVYDADALAGKVVVLDFWATWCGPCLMAMPGIEALWDEHRDGDDVLVLAMNVFENGDPDAVMADKGFTYPNLLRADEVAQTLGYTSIPQVVVVDRDGVIRRELRGFSPGHERTLREAVDALLAGDDARAEPAEAFPPFSLRGVDGAALSLSDLRGKVAVFDFWATWCGPCVRAMPGMQRIHETLGTADDVVVIGMNVFERGDPAALLAKKGITYTNLLEADAVAEALGITAIPEVIVVGRDGAIVERITGFVEDHEERVTAAIAAGLAR